MDLKTIRNKVIEFHKSRGYEIKPPVPLSNPAFPYTYNASAAEVYMKEVIEARKENPEKKFIVIQPCFRRVDIENIMLNGYLSLFEMVGKIWFNQNFEKDKEKVLKEMLDFFVDEIGLDKSKIWISVFGGGKIAEIGKTILPKDKKTEKFWLNIRIPKDKIVKIKSNGKDIDNFLVRFVREWEKYAGYGTDIFYDLGEKSKKSKTDILPGNVKGGRFVELATIWMLDKWRISDYGKSVKLNESNFKNFAIGFSIERLAYVSQQKKHILEIEDFENFFKIIKTYIPKNRVYAISDILRAIFFIMSEGNKTGKRGKEYDLRLLFRKLFSLFEKDIIEDSNKVIKTILENGKEHLRKNIFGEIVEKEIKLLEESYGEFFKYYGEIYPHLENSIKNIMRDYNHEKILFYENQFQKVKSKVPQ